MAEVYFYEAFEEETEAIGRYLPGHLAAGFTWQTIQEEGAGSPPAPVISVRTQSVMPKEWGSGLAGVLTRSTGYDHVAAYVDSCGRSIPAGYLPLYCNRAVAEQAMLLWMALLRRLPQQVKQFGSFHRDGLTGRECEGKHLLVVGVGQAGSETVRVGQGLGMAVRGVDLVERCEFVSYTTLAASLAWADIIVCAMNLTADNAGYFSEAVLRRARPGAIFVNVARGELSPAAGLLRLVKEGHLGGVGLDVYSHESELAVSLREGRSSDDPEVVATLALGEQPNVILTPHNAFNTYESVDRKAAQSVEQIVHFLERGAFLWPVPPSGCAGTGCGVGDAKR